MYMISQVNTEAKKHQGAQKASGDDQPNQNRSYQRYLRNIRGFTCEEMGHYASFYEKQAPAPVVAHAGPVEHFRLGLNCFLAWIAPIWVFCRFDLFPAFTPFLV